MPNLKVKVTARNASPDLLVSTDAPVTAIPFSPYDFNAADLSMLNQSFTNGGAKPILDGDPVGYFNGLLGAGSPGHTGASPIYRPGILNNLPVVESRNVNLEYLENPTLAGGVSTAYWSCFTLCKFIGAPAVLGELLFGVGENGFGPWQTDDGCNFIGVGGVGDGTARTSSSISGDATTQIVLQSSTDFTTGFFLFENHTTPAASVSYVNGTEEGRDDAWRGTPLTPDYMRMFASGSFGPGSVPSTHINAQLARNIFYPWQLTTAQINFIRGALMQQWLPLSPFVWLP